MTSRRLCFAFSEPGLAPIKLAAKQLKAAAKLPADAAKGACALRRPAPWAGASLLAAAGLGGVCGAGELPACLPA